jgi:condensin complex subunit 1
MGTQSMSLDGDQTMLEGVEEGDEGEDGDQEGEEGEFEEGDETVVEGDEEGEDFTQEFGDEGHVPGTPAPTNRTMGGQSEVPMTPRTPARSRVPKTPAKSSARTPKPKDKKKKKKKARKSEALDLAALNNEQAALAALESNHILHLRLRKKYYAEGLNFIKQVEGSIEILSQLLVSTSKAEVLESMEFFRVAHEYQFESAQVCSYC